MLRAPDECRHALALFHQAAAYVRHITAHGIAERYLAAALALAGQPDSGADAALLLALQQERHAALYQLGRLGDADQAYTQIAAACGDPVRLAESAAVQISSLMLRNHERAALDLGLPLLRALGMALPETDMAAQLPAQLDQLFRWIQSLDLAVDLARQAPREPRQLARNRLARQLILPALFTDPVALAWLVLEAQRSWEQAGPSAALTFRLAHANMVTAAWRKDYRTGYDVQRHVLAVAQALGDILEAWQVSFLLTISGLHWFEPMEQCVALARRASEGLLQEGEWQVACFNHYTLIVGALD